MSDIKISNYLKSHFYNNMIQATLLFVMCVMLASCSILGGEGDDDDDYGNEASTSGGGKVLESLSGDGGEASKIVVQHVGEVKPIISPYDRKYWISLKEISGNEPKQIAQKMVALLATGEAEDAIEEAKRFLAIQPGNKMALTVLTAALVMARKYDLAAYYAKHLEEASGGSSEALNVKALAIMLAAQSRLSEYRRAEKIFRESLDASAKEVAAGLNLGRLYLEIGDARKAAGVFDLVSSRCNSCEEALLGVGISAARLKQYDKAKDTWESVLSKNPKSHRALYHLALVYKNGYNDYDQAEKILRGLIEDDSVNKLLQERANATMRSVATERRVKH